MSTCHCLECWINEHDEIYSDDPNTRKTSILIPLPNLHLLLAWWCLSLDPHAVAAFGTLRQVDEKSHPEDHYCTKPSRIQRFVDEVAKKTQDMCAWDMSDEDDVVFEHRDSWLARICAGRSLIDHATYLAQRGLHALAAALYQVLMTGWTHTLVQKFRGTGGVRQIRDDAKWKMVYEFVQNDLVDCAINLGMLRFAADGAGRFLHTQSFSNTRVITPHFGYPRDITEAINLCTNSQAFTFTIRQESPTKDALALFWLVASARGKLDIPINDLFSTRCAGSKRPREALSQDSWAHTIQHARRWLIAMCRNSGSHLLLADNLRPASWDVQE